MCGGFAVRFAPTYSLVYWEEKDGGEFTTLTALQRQVTALLTRWTSEQKYLVHLRRVDLHLVEGIDGDEDVSHVRVDLISPVATLQLLCDGVLKPTQVAVCLYSVLRPRHAAADPPLRQQHS